jgi:alpha-D-ribose 1-methylphosphonate 5-triphosphate synthase subunit PhnG
MEQIHDTLNSNQINRAVRCMERTVLRDMLQRLANLGVEVVREPETGLIMMNVSDCFQTDFHLGEVLVTTAEVSLNGYRGWGMVMGDDGDRALLLACLDAVFQDPDNGLRAELDDELLHWLDRANTLATEELQRAAATKVSFDSMATE